MKPQDGGQMPDYPHAAWAHQQAREVAEDLLPQQGVLRTQGRRLLDEPARYGFYCFLLYAALRTLGWW